MGTLKRLIKAAEAQFVTDNAAAAAVAPGTASDTDFLEKMKKEPRKVCLLAGAPFANRLQALLQVHVDIRSKMKGISLEDMPLECLPEGTRSVCRLALRLLHYA